jgi:hypothetical protein
MKEEILEKLKVFDDVNFKFVEDTHTYTINGRKLTSVTTFIKNFYKPFDEKYWSIKKAKQALLERGEVLTQENIDNEQSKIKALWKEKADIACDMGTIVHLYIEEFFNGIKPQEVKNYEAINRINKFHKIYNDKLKDILIPVGQEVKMFSEDLGLAGTIDALFIRNGKLEIWDYKTNGKFTSDTDRCFQKLLDPFDDQWENELNKYSIQLSLYKLMLASVGIKVDGDNVILYFPPEGEAKIIKCKDYTRILEKYFNVNYYSDLCVKK